MPSSKTAVTGPIPPMPGLLVSVRSAQEAIAAVEGGADVVDIKEPKHGPLGAATASTVESVIQAVAGRHPVTVALGELVDEPTVELALPGVSVVKVGLADSFADDWSAKLSELSGRLPAGVELAAVAYADHQEAESPDPEAVLADVSERGGRWLVLDTYNKTGRSSLELMPPEQLSALVASAAKKNVRIVLAGRVGTEDLHTAAAYRPWLIGVRGAACVGGRAGQISEDRVRSLAQSLAGCRLHA